MTNYIWITTQKELFHSYPDAPMEVKYLKDRHRHIFHFKVFIEVFHDNRDLEFIMFKNYINEIIETFGTLNLSCEMMSDTIAKQVMFRYPKRKMKIEVSEDGENGTQFEY